ncbi:MAG: hypothetical protein ABIG64_03680 [Candidatus Omnitrophota bacterium]
MLKKISSIVCVCFLMAIVCSPIFAQEENTLKGIVQEVAEDGAYVVIEGQKIMISDEIEGMDLEEGDEVELIIKETENGPVAVDYNYM